MGGSEVRQRLLEQMKDGNTASVRLFITLLEEIEGLHERIDALERGKVEPQAEKPGVKVRMQHQRWLVEFLAARGPCKRADVVAAAKEAGISQGTLYRVRRSLDGVVLDTHGWRDSRNCWYVAEEGDGDDSGE